MSGAWSKGTNKAVATPPPPTSSLQAAASGGGPGPNNNRRGSTGPGNNSSGGGRNNNNRRRTSGGGRGGRGGDRYDNENNNNYGRGRGGGRHNNNNKGGRGRGGRGNDRNNSNRVIIKDVQLLDETGMGDTAEQQQVTRFSARMLLRVRLQFTDPPEQEGLFNPHKDCTWTDDPKRIEELQAWSSKAIELGDVSKKNAHQKDTAPALEDCKPLEVNEETRWKPKVIAVNKGEDVSEETGDDTPEAAVAKALVILNKVSWTTLPKLTTKLMEVTQLVENDAKRKAVIELLVHKANTEHHFGAMYAEMCSLIAKQIKSFKKELLTQCQHEFEMDTEHKIAKAIEGVDDEEEKAYKAGLVKKAYIGHMKFLGELYMRDVVKLSIMMYCLDELLKDDKNAENLECFATMMTTMGHKLDDHAKQNNKAFDWSKVEDIMTHKGLPMRIKFLLKDLLELRERGWIKRRLEERAKSLHEIHADIAKEEQKQQKGGMPKRPSQTQLRRASSLAAAAITDSDGFTSVPPGRRGSQTNLAKMPEKPSAAQLRRTQSQPAIPSKRPSLSFASTPPPSDPKEIEKKTQNILKEYFVGGDTAEAVLSISELVQVGTDGSLERSSKIVEAGTLLVLERKAEDVEKFLTVMGQCLAESKIDAGGIATGLQDPLEFLSDVEIDAPLAGNHLAVIVAKGLQVGAITNLKSFLKDDSPEYFRTDGKPAVLCVKILKARGGDVTDDDVALVDSLMTAADKETHASGKAMVDAMMA